MKPGRDSHPRERRTHKMNTKKSKIKPYTRQFYRGNGIYFALAVFETVLTTAVNLLISWLLQQVLDLVSGEAVSFTLVQLALMSLASVVMIALGSCCAYFSTPRFMAKAMAQYKTYVFERLSQKGVSAFYGENSSLYISALSNDAAVIESDYVGSLFDIIQQCLLFAAALTMMLIYNPLLTVVSVGLSALPIIVSVFAGNRMAVAEKRVSDLNESYMSTLKDSLAGFSVIKSFRAEVQMCKLFSEEVRKVANAKEKSKKIRIIISMCSSIASVAVQLGVFIVGAWLAVSGCGVTAGTVLVFVQLLNYVLNPIGAIPTCLAQRKAAKALIVKLADALDENVREDGAIEKHTLNNGIRLDGVSFGYEADKPVLHEILLEFKAGKRYAVVGASGSGKSTLLNLLMASNGNYSGNIYYDDAELRTLRGESLYGMVSVVQQNVFIFNASIRDNITMFADFPEDEVERAIALSGLSELIKQKGEDYLCGENGNGLSGGEKQRISIARSLLKKAQVLLVDEATAALDAETAYQVSSAILGLKDVTSIVVTHSLDEDLLKQYDGIITLKNGLIVEKGTFDKLIAEKGYFYSLFTVSQ